MMIGGAFAVFTCGMRRLFVISMASPSAAVDPIPTAGSPRGRPSSGRSRQVPPAQAGPPDDGAATLGRQTLHVAGLAMDHQPETNPISRDATYPSASRPALTDQSPPKPNSE